MRTRVVNIGFAPSADGLATVVNFNHRAIVGESFAGPVLQEANEIFGAAAVVATGCRHISGHDGSVALDAAASFKLFAIEPLWTFSQFLKERGREEEAAPYEARWAELSPTMAKRAARIA